MTRPPTLVVVTGPPGSGTTTLAHELARAVPCPAVCRDELKEGLLHGETAYVPAAGDAVAYRTLEVFFGVVRYLVESGVTLVAEASFQHRRWADGLTPFLDRARVRVVICRTDSAMLEERIARRELELPSRARFHLRPPPAGGFDPPRLAVPTLDVDTTEGYHPSFADVVAFVG